MTTCCGKLRLYPGPWPGRCCQATPTSAWWPLFLPKVPGSPETSRLRLISLLALGGVLIWYFTFHQDRYLQVLMPLMATSVLVTINRLWKMKLPVRIALGLVLFVQFAWGSNHPFIPSHAMVGQAVLKHTIDFLGSGFSAQGRWQTRFTVDAGLEAVGALTPKGTKRSAHCFPLCGAWIILPAATLQLAEMALFTVESVFSVTA